MQKSYVEVGGQKVPVEIHIERRRSIRFYLGKKGGILRLPKHLPLEDKKKEWNRFSDWLTRQIEKRGNGAHAFGKTYQHGDELVVGSRSYQINIEETDNKTHSAKLEGEGVIGVRLSTHASDEQRNKAMQHLLSRVVADDFLPEIKRRVTELNHMHFQKRVNGVKLKYNRSNWGSCSSKGNINLSTCLLFAPNDVIDYVIIHELAHLIEMNHSSRFWKLVETAMPTTRRKKSGSEKIGRPVFFKCFLAIDLCTGKRGGVGGSECQID